MTLATSSELYELEVMYASTEQNESHVQREKMWISAIQHLTIDIFESALEHCTLHDLNDENFLQCSPYDGFPVTSSATSTFFLSVYAYPPFRFQSGEGIMIGPNLVGRTLFVYCLEYANGNQTLKEAVESSSLKKSVQIPRILENAGFKSCWYARKQRTPSLFFWKG